MKLKLSDFDYKLPQELIAQYPAASRESSRMLVLDRGQGGIFHKNFRDISSYIKREDILVLNDTKVINARLKGRRATGGKVEIFLLEDIGEGRFKTLIRSSGRLKEGEEIFFDKSNLKARLLMKKKAGNIIEFLPPSNDLVSLLAKSGEVPLPPYIRRKAEALDNERYQTVYARTEGATAAPTAGLHFTEKILEDIILKGAGLTYVTLHVNYGTFAPVRSEDIVNHKMHDENFELTQDAAVNINSAKAKNGRIFTVGTTSCRVLETCAFQPMADSRWSMEYGVKSKKGRTDLFIYPGYKFKMVDALLTNFHLPKSTLLMLVSAFAGGDLIFKAYKEAVERKYRFFSYGDCMLIL